MLRHKGTGPREVTLRLGLGTSPHLEADSGMGRARPSSTSEPEVDEEPSQEEIKY